MAGSVDVNSTTQQKTSQRTSSNQSLGDFRFGDNNLGERSGSTGGPGGSFTPLTLGIIAAGVLVGIWLWKRPS